MYVHYKIYLIQMPDVSSLTNAVMGMILSYQIDKNTKPATNKNDDSDNKK